MNIAVMCSGGDCSGMNPAIKRFVEYSFEKNIKPFFIYDGLEGMIDGHIKEAEYTDVSGIIHRGGTIIRSSRSKRFYEKKYRKQAFENLKKKEIEAVVVLGGDGSFKACQILKEEFEINFAGIPATIDNDVYGTDYCLGTDTALNVIRHSIDNIRDTAASFSRAFVIETMGRECGYLALISALTSGAEMCLIPEASYDLNSLEKKFKKEIKKGRNYFIAIVSEALKISEDIKNWFEEKIGFESRLTILGHIQRGGSPTIFDRLMAYEFMSFALDGILNKNEDTIVVYKNRKFGYINSKEVSENRYQLDKNMILLAKNMMK
ncbi:6-phosphofructokinase [Nitrosophilus alvini]|uniref:6-phosphofructokinase n=1 Tax=Nitrosophilus alvini TaxID=2714855 RepID=UPI00190919CB|nr:6-phosphofructokinase [Nitrosophilus alvini]